MSVGEMARVIWQLSTRLARSKFAAQCPFFIFDSRKLAVFLLPEVRTTLAAVTATLCSY